MAKGIGNGAALAAVVTTPQIAQALASRIHFNTFGGNPVACTQGRAVLEVIDEDGIQANAAQRQQRQMQRPFTGGTDVCSCRSIGGRSSAQRRGPSGINYRIKIRL
jgi:acetylornithine/succinyldiaminopimelate/putrescine aminotransferase